jgi:predicted Holliday junction resolvase-like endonuclease
MSSLQTPTLTYEQVLEMFRLSDERFEKNRQKDQERWEKERVERKQAEAIADAKFRQEMREAEEKFNRMSKKINKKISDLGSRIGEIVEHMVGGNIIEQFQTLGYEVTFLSRNATFVNKKLGIKGEFDLVLDDGDVVIFIEVKTTLETSDVRRHMEKLEKFRRYTDAKPEKSQKRFIGAVAGAVVRDDAMNFAHENGMYAIVQSGKAVEILPVPEGFRVREW